MRVFPLHIFRAYVTPPSVDFRPSITSSASRDPSRIRSTGYLLSIGTRAGTTELLSCELQPVPMFDFPGCCNCFNLCQQGWANSHAAYGVPLEVDGCYHPVATVATMVGCREIPPLTESSTGEGQSEGRLRSSSPNKPPSDIRVAAMRPRLSRCRDLRSEEARPMLM